MRFRYAIITHAHRGKWRCDTSRYRGLATNKTEDTCAKSQRQSVSPLPKFSVSVWASSLTVVLHFRKLCGGCFYGPRCDPRAALVAIIVASWHSSLYSSFYITLSALTHYRFEPVKVSSINQISQHRTSLAGHARCSCAGWTCPFGGFNLRMH